jgi:hypothetical protein
VVASHQLKIVSSLKIYYKATASAILSPIKNETADPTRPYKTTRIEGFLYDCAKHQARFQPQHYGNILFSDKSHILEKIPCFGGKSVALRTPFSENHWFSL